MQSTAPTSPAPTVARPGRERRWSPLCALLVVSLLSTLVGCKSTRGDAPPEASPPPVGSEETPDAGERATQLEAGWWSEELGSGDPQRVALGLVALDSQWDAAAGREVLRLVFGEDAELRQLAASVIARHGTRDLALECVGLIGEAGDAAPALCYEVLALLGRDDPALVLVTLVDRAVQLDAPMEMRRAAVAGLATLGEPAAVPVLVELQAARDPELSPAAGAALAALTFDSSVTRWGEWWQASGDLDRSAWAARRIEVDNLAPLCSEELVAGQRLRDPVMARLREDLLAAIAFLGDPDGATRLLEVARRSPVAEGRIAALALVPDLLQIDCGREQLVTLLLEGLEDPEVPVQLAAIRVATRASVAEAMPACIELLAHPEREVRRAAVSALRAFSGENHGFDPDADLDSARRGFAIEIWRSWWEGYEREDGAAR